MRWLPLFALIGCVEYSSLAPSGNDLPGETPAGGSGPPNASTLPEGWGMDGWDLPSSSTIDVIVYGDTSTSMTEELVTMGDAVRPFVERLAQSVPDWQLAAVTGDTGCAVNGILRPDTADFEGKFADAIVTPPVMNGVDIDEMGFQNTAIAVEESDGGCNDGLVRGGLLHLIYISDENDESPGFDGSQDYWRDYFDRIVQAHGDSLMITVSAVIGPQPDGCVGGGADADPGDGYAEAVSATGGEALSICTEWADDIDLLADAGTTKDTFALSEVPIPESIQVWLDGVAVAPVGRWTYDAAKNAVVFLASPPVPGQRVDIAYEVEQG